MTWWMPALLVLMLLGAELAIVVDAVLSRKETARLHAKHIAALDAQIARLRAEREEWKRTCAAALDTSGAP